FIMGLIQKDRQMESLVEKLCLRFRISQTERQWCDLAYCLSLVQYSDRSVRRLHENLHCYADKLHSSLVFDIFTSIISAISKTTKPELKVVVDELETKIKECNAKGAEEVLVAEKASAARKSKTPRGKIATPRNRSTRSSVRRQNCQSSDSSDEDASDKENHGSTTQKRQSARIRTSRNPPPQPVIESEDSEEEDVFVKPRAPVPKTPAPASRKAQIAENPESSDEEVTDSSIASPVRKKHCNDKDSSKHSVGKIAQKPTTPRSTPRRTNNTSK
ncbi:hypothetical protein L9F63_019073, partial [Diploptera punctata]